MKKKIYEGIICLLAIISVVLAVHDYNTGLSVALIYLDNTIGIIFIADYTVRLILSQNKIKFFKENILDLIAILPFNSTLRILRTLKFFKLLKFTRLLKATRFISLLSRLYKKIGSFFNTNGFKYMVLLSVILVFTGGVLISVAENMTLQDGIWWAFVTTTTVGYGDISPDTHYGRIIAMVLMVVGIGLIGSVTSTLTSFFMSDEKNSAISNDKVNMVLKMYNELNKNEKELFNKTISENSCLK